MAAHSESVATRASHRVGVLPAEASIDKIFTYSVSAADHARLRIGSMVRVEVRGRRVDAWVLDLDPELIDDVTLLPITKVVSEGPAADLVELAQWCAYRWAGRRATFLKPASPKRRIAIGSVAPVVARTSDVKPMGGLTAGRGFVDGLTPAQVAIAEGRWPETPDHSGAKMSDLVQQALSSSRALVLSPPAMPFGPWLQELAGAHRLVVVVPEVAMVHRAIASLRRAGVEAVAYPDDWLAAARGAHVVGTRSAAFAPYSEGTVFVLLDEHDEALEEEGSPSWNAREVLAQRSEMLDAPLICFSASPTADAALRFTPLRLSRREERLGWAPVDVIDMNREDYRSGMWSEELAGALRGAEHALVVLNQKGRVRLLACASCGQLARCQSCGAACGSDDDQLECQRCGTVRPEICDSCYSVSFKHLRLGVSKAREHLEALLGEPVDELTADPKGRGLSPNTPPNHVTIGTEAALHRLSNLDLVAFVDFEQELCAPRYRAAQQAMTLIVRAARAVGGSRRGGRVIVQTRVLDHPTLKALDPLDPMAVARHDVARSKVLGWPPAWTVAEVANAGAPVIIERLGTPVGVTVERTGDSVWYLRSLRAADLLSELARCERPSKPLRLRVDAQR